MLKLAEYQGTADSVTSIFKLAIHDGLEEETMFYNSDFWTLIIDRQPYRSKLSKDNSLTEFKATARFGLATKLGKRCPGPLRVVVMADGEDCPTLIHKEKDIKIRKNGVLVEPVRLARWTPSPVFAEVNILENVLLQYEAASAYFKSLPRLSHRAPSSSSSSNSQMMLPEVPPYTDVYGYESDSDLEDCEDEEDTNPTSAERNNVLVDDAAYKTYREVQEMELKFLRDHLTLEVRDKLSEMVLKAYTPEFAHCAGVVVEVVKMLAGGLADRCPPHKRGTICGHHWQFIWKSRFAGMWQMQRSAINKERFDSLAESNLEE
ncbi:hypothetical protein NEOLEDRAFT_1172935 [Neolentinus lepideus HHB14362 ss-1]|uniref:Uncharacterized protein n=1 Tax=Neolentinus lepideus HHB14362 ss-1 TaxID=1314782 RepID=A0A165NJC2_9AGAM|nr:hypothetical protein NEOLEDRAFT_1172935 [Neolentinus lepideus HHB14362 ss-1]